MFMDRVSCLGQICWYKECRILAHDTVNISPRTHVTPFLNEHGMLKLKSRRKHHLECLIFDIIKFTKHVYLCDKLFWLITSRDVTSRNCASFRYSASKISNNLPPPIRQCENIGIFKFNFFIICVILWIV